MSGSRFIIVSVLLILLASSCGEEKFYRIDSTLTGSWEAQEFMSLESVAYLKVNDFSPLIEFYADGTYRLTLDVNACIGNYSISENKALECSPAACTKMCCDSPFSIKLTEMLPRVTGFEFDQNELKLTVPEWGWIRLNR